jgi:perosamine synthetase
VDWFVYVVRLDPEIDRSRLIEDLDAAGVPTRPYFSPLHLQPFYQQALGHVPGDFPVTERVAASTLAIPFSARLPDEDVRYVADAIIEAVGRQSRA